MNFIISPKIKFSKNIRKIQHTSGKVSFEIMIENCSCFLSVNDISIMYKFITYYSGSNNTSKIYENMLAFCSNIKIPYINRQKIFNTKDRKHIVWIQITVDIDQIKEYILSKKTIYKTCLNENSELKTDINIENFLQEDNTIQFIAYGYSAFTGIKKTYLSKPMTCADIKTGDGWNDYEVVSNT
jgi:hypothetical protein